MTEPALPLLVEPDELERALGRAGLVVVDASDEATFLRHHVPGAIHLPYQEIIAARPPAMGLLPDDRHLEAVLSRLGLSRESHVVACDAEANIKACRLLWTLDAVGHERFSLLNGGLAAWVNEGHRTELGAHRPTAGAYKILRRTEAVADRAYILAHLHDPGVVILDTRSGAEFSGADVRSARGGHIPGAVNLDWIMAVDRERNLRFKPAHELRPMLERLDITPEKEVIAHCQTHHRSSHSYIVLKWLGYGRIRGYDGSWSEWGNDPT
ncbi:MAG: sulfurtransferase, partial [Alphaproteobacteria bacterium]